MKPDTDATAPSTTTPMDTKDPAHPANRRALTAADAAADLAGKPRPKKGGKAKNAKVPKPPKAKRTIERFSLVQWVRAEEARTGLPISLAMKAIEKRTPEFAASLRRALGGKRPSREALDAKVAKTQRAYEDAKRARDAGLERDSGSETFTATLFDVAKKIADAASPSA